MSVHAAALHELALARMRICVKRFIYTCLVGIISSGLGHSDLCVFVAYASYSVGDVYIKHFRNHIGSRLISRPAQPSPMWLCGCWHLGFFLFWCLESVAFRCHSVAWSLNSVYVKAHIYIYIYIYISNDAARQSATGLNLLFCVFLWRVCLRACLFVCWFVSFFVCLFRLCVFFKLLATLGLHFHTPLRPLCTFGLHLGSFLRSLGTLGPSFGVLFSTLGAQGQLCGLFWHPRGPKVENH